MNHFRIWHPELQINIYIYRPALYIYITNINLSLITHPPKNIQAVIYEKH